MQVFSRRPERKNKMFFTEATCSTVEKILQDERNLSGVKTKFEKADFSSFALGNKAHLLWQEMSRSNCAKSLLRCKGFMLRICSWNLNYFFNFK